MSLTELGFDRLSASDRLALAEALWDSVHAELTNQPIHPDVQSELERRIALSDADPTRGVPWETVREAARARWQR